MKKKINKGLHLGYGIIIYSDGGGNSGVIETIYGKTGGVFFAFGDSLELTRKSVPTISILRYERLLSGLETAGPIPS